MDSFIYSAKFVNYILKETKNDLSIEIGDETVLVPNVDYEKKIVVFPYYQEALLILHEIGTPDQFLCFFLALYMLQNDDYDLCEELLHKLYQLGLPSCSDAKALYKSTIVKHLFIMLHECGHYLNFSQNEFDYLCEKYFINDTFFSQDFEVVKDDSVQSFFSRLLSECNVNDKESTQFFIDQVVKSDVKENAREFFRNGYKSNESKADLSALLMMRIFAESIMQIKDVDVLKAIAFVELFSLLGLLINSNREESEITRIRQQYGIENTRQRISSLIAYNFFEADDSISFEQVIESEFQKGAILAVRINEEYQKYFDSWVDGNKNNGDRDEERYKYLLDGIYGYFVALKDLYQYEE